MNSKRPNRSGPCAPLTPNVSDEVAFSLGSLPVFLNSNSDAGIAAGVFFGYSSVPCVTPVGVSSALLPDRMRRV
jgi:hypothetical protein